MNQLNAALAEQLLKAQEILSALPDMAGEKKERGLEALVRTAQYIALDARKLWANNVIRTAESSPESIIGAITEGFELDITPGYVVLDIPILLPKRKAPGMDFFLESLTAFLHTYREHLPRFSHATVIFRHIYAPGFPERDIRDHDNHEIRAVLNVIERFLLVSDSACYCTNIQQTQQGSETKTRIIVMQGQMDLEVLHHANC